ncbi:cytochrome P450 [Sphingobium sp. EP60837]|uniref:cytochrome P450 n=1 Tax=Sphingobium sp. EP60837 TaxID=1855519 RepID=UPI0007DD3A88|nr:cytochrome P450 [Sphingobium sp. EP60837]ANI80230.1 Cytochrome p450 CYP199A2 [Sphingobium sp. EP60837]
MSLPASAPAGVPTSEIDLFAPKVLEDPHRFDGELREIGPVVWLEKHGVYAVTRHKAIQSMYADWRNFHNFGSPFNPDTLIPAVIIIDNPPQHTRLRSAIMPYVSPAALARYRKDFETTAQLLIEQILDEREFDARDLAASFVLKAFPDLLGLPLEGRHFLLNFGEAILNTLGPMNDLTIKSLERAGPAFAWVQSECSREKVLPGKLASKVYALTETADISEEEAGLLVRTLLAAGFDTTILGITAAFYGFTQNPDQWQLLSDPKMVRAAFEEGIRYFPPNRFGGRLVAADTEFEGAHFKSGDRITTLLAAAGRDPRRWDDADVFDITRPARSHLSFGHGIHACLGQVLSRTEYDVLITALFKHVARIEAAGPAERAVNNVALGWGKVPIRLTLR